MAGEIEPPSMPPLEARLEHGPLARRDEVLADTRERILRSVKCADPWDSGFNFVDPVLEASYWDARVRRDLWFVDTTAHCNCALMAAGLLAPLRAAAAPDYLTSGLLPAWIGLRAALSLWAFEGGKAYLAWRTTAIAVVRLLFAFLGAVIGWWAPPPEATPWAVLTRVVSGSMVIGLVATSVGLQVKSSVGVKIQFVATALSMLMVPGYCAAGLDECRFAPALQVIGGTIDRVMQYTAFGLFRLDMGGPSDQDGQAYTCWMVVTFMQWAVGFLLTSTVVYCIEGWSRVCFVRSCVEVDGQVWRRLRSRWLGSACTAVGVACVAAASIWELLRITEEARQLGTCDAECGDL
eukprot:evm.model.scf_668EXC.1 EVM.evm.TU.scf_668EXC.1   scf_668EXC:11794-12843(+)